MVEYEILHTKAWSKKIVHVEKSLNSTLLVKDHDTETLHVNFDPQINELMREIDVMDQMRISVPLKAREMRMKREEIKTKYNNLKVTNNNHTHQLSSLYFFS